MLAAAAAGAAVHTSSLVLSGTSYHAPRGGGLSDPREIAERLSSAIPQQAEGHIITESRTVRGTSA